MGRLYRRGETWWADFYHRKQGRVRVSLRTQDRKVATERLRLAELAETNPAENRQARTLGAAIGYMVGTASADRADATRSFYQQKTRHIARIFGAGVDVSSIRKDDVLRYEHKRLAEKAHRHTVGKELIALRRVLVAEHERSPLPVHPKDIIPTWKMNYVPRRRFLTPHQFEAVLARAPAARRSWLMVAVYTGACLGELERLEGAHFNLRNKQVTLPGTKAKDRFRVVPIPAPLMPWATQLAKRRGLVFSRWSNVRRDLAAIATAARVPTFTPNDLRRTYASWMVQAGVPHLTVAHLLGHSSTRMVEKVYGRLTPAVYADAVAKLPGCDAGVPDTGPLSRHPGTIGTGKRARNASKSKESECPGTELNRRHADFQARGRR